MKPYEKTVNRGNGKLNFLRVRTYKQNGNVLEDVLGNVVFNYDDSTKFVDVMNAAFEMFKHAKEHQYESNHLKLLAFFDLKDIPENLKEKLTKNITIKPLPKRDDLLEGNGKKKLSFVHASTKVDTLLQNRNHIEHDHKKNDVFEYDHSTSIIQVLSTAKEWYESAMWYGYKSNHRKLLEFFEVPQSMIKMLETEAEISYRDACDRW